MINVDLPSIEWRQPSLPSEQWDCCVTFNMSAPLTGSNKEEQRLYPIFMAGV
jgi:hypothetical protein